MLRYAQDYEIVNERNQLTVRIAYNLFAQRPTAGD